MTTFSDERATSGKLSLAEILETFAGGGELPLKFSAYDGSSAGPDDAALGLAQSLRDQGRVDEARSLLAEAAPRYEGRGRYQNAERSDALRWDRIERLTVQDERYPQQKGRRLIDYLAGFGYRP